MRIVNWTAVFAIAMLAACSGDGTGPKDQHDCSIVAEGSAAWNDWGCEVPMANLTLNIDVNGSPASLDVFANGEFVGKSNEQLQVRADEDILIQVGDSDTWTNEDNSRPIANVDGLQWVAEDLVLNGGEGDNLTGNLTFNRYLDATYNCGSDVYYWDYGTGDNKGEFFRHDSSPLQRISIEDGFRVVPESGISGLPEQMMIDVDSLYYDESAGSLIITSSKIKDDGTFLVTIASQDVAVNELTCKVQ